MVHLNLLKGDAIAGIIITVINIIGGIIIGVVMLNMDIGRQQLKLM